VELPVTINGRIFPREDIDVWRIHAEAGQTVACEVNAARIGSRLDSRLEVRDSQGRTISENDDHSGADSFVRFIAPGAGTYEIRIHDIAYGGSQDCVYRLTITSELYIDHIFPLGGQRGSDVAFQLYSQQVPGDASVRVVLAGEPGVRLHQFEVGVETSNPVPVIISDNREVVENEQAFAAGVKIDEPIVLNGCIRQPGEVDRWSIHGQADRSVSFDLKAASLGSQLDATIQILDVNGAELLEAGSTPTNFVEPTGVFTIPNTGSCFIDVHHVDASDGGGDFAYRLTLDPGIEPDFQLALPTDALTLFRGADANLDISVQRTDQFDQPIKLTVQGLPTGVAASQVVVAADETAGQIVLTASGDAPIAGVPIRVSGVALHSDDSDRVKEPAMIRHALMPSRPGDSARDEVLLAVCMPTPFRIVGDRYRIEYAARGTIHRRPFVIHRGGYKGPFTIRLADEQVRHLQGVTGDEMTVSAGVSEFRYSIKVPTWLEMSRTGRIVVTAVGEITDEQEIVHRVSASSTPSDDQIVILTAPSPLSVSASPSSLAVSDDSKVEITVTVKRGQLTNRPVTVELLAPPHIEGVVAHRVQFSPDQDQGSLNIRLASVSGPFNMPVKIRVTTKDDHGDPVIAECQLDLVKNVSP